MNQCVLQRLPAQAARQSIAGLAFFALTIASLLGFSAAAAQAQTFAEQTVYSFGSNSSTDGAAPNGNLVLLDSSLYGITSGGGTNSHGTVFFFDPSSKNEVTLYSFGTNNPDGSQPEAGLVLIGSVLFGTTTEGGANSNDSGTIFSYDLSDSDEFTDYNFLGNTTNSTDGSTPTATLLNVNDILYGTTSAGGTSHGTVFSIDPNSLTKKTIHTFTGSGDGSNPHADLINVNSVLFGTTSNGGAHSDGTVFSINPDGTGYQTVYSFAGGTGDGSHPESGLVLLNGLLYGDTTQDGTNALGTVFSIDPTTGTEKVVYNFGSGSADGTGPTADLIVVGSLLFGTTSGGGSGHGTVFAINPTTNAETVIYRFQGGTADGSVPNAPLLNVNGTLFGLTESGGIKNHGTIFSLTPLLAPTAVNDTFTANYKTTLTISAPGVLANDNNGNDPPVTAALVTGPTHGSLTLNSNGSFTYTPTGAFVGTDTFTYKDTNAIGTSNTATVTITVQAVAPIAVNNSNNVTEDTPLTVPAPGVLGNDDNGGSSPITASLVSTVSHGTLTLSTNGAFTYTPNHGFVGTDQFTYQAVNSVGKSNIATATLTVKAGVPTAINNSNNVKADTPFTVPAPGVLGNDFDGGSPITASLVTTTGHGTLTLNSNGGFTYTPAHGFIGTDTFTYQAVNSVGKSNVATATLIVQASVPTAVNNSNNVKADTPLTVPAPGVLGNDFDGGSPMTALLVTNVSHGTLTLSSNGAFTYTPSHGFIGTDSFTYQAVNATGKSNIATATLTVQASVPTAVNNSNNVKKNTTFTVAAPGVLGNDFDGGSPMTALLVTTTSHGTLTLSSNGGFTYTPNTNFTGTDSFTYQAVNSIGKSNIASATLIVQ